MALLLRLLRKDHPSTPKIALLFAENALSDHPTTRSFAQKYVESGWLGILDQDMTFGQGPN